MDNKRLNTEDFIKFRLFAKEAPPSSAPADFKGQDVYDFKWSEESLKQGLLGRGLEAWMCYGGWKIWKEINNTYSGELFQYRSITDKFEKESFDYAFKKAIEWASGCEG